MMTICGEVGSELDDELDEPEEESVWALREGFTQTLRGGVICPSENWG